MAEQTALRAWWKNFPIDPGDTLAGPESDDIAAEFAALGELKRTEDSDIQSSEPIGEVEGNALDLDRGEYHNERCPTEVVQVNINDEGE